MDKEKFDLLEVRPENKGIYEVTLYNFVTEVYLREDLLYNGDKWEYGKYDSHYVCFVHSFCMGI